MFIRYLAPFSFSLILSACGGGSSSPSTEPVVLDKYDADTYSPKVVSQNGLGGAWLYVMKFDLTYSQDDFDPDVSIRFQVEMRTIVNLVETESGLEVHNPWGWCRAVSEILIVATPSMRCFSDPAGYASSEDSVLTLDLGHGEFIGSINSENNRIDGQVTSYSEDLLVDIHTTVHSSQGGMIKLSDTPSLPSLSEIPSTWGEIDYSEVGVLPLNSFIESTMLIEYINAEEVVRTEQIYDMKGGSIQEVSTDSSVLPSYSLRRQFSFVDFISARNSGDYFEGWFFSLLSNHPEIGVSSFLPGALPVQTDTFWGEDIQDQAPLVLITNASEIIGNVSVTHERVIEINGSFIADGEETFTVDILVDLK